MAASVVGTSGKEKPIATRQKDANKAIKSSDLRQNITTPTTTHTYTAANRRLIVTRYAAYAVIEIPRVWSDWILAGVRQSSKQL